MRGNELAAVAARSLLGSRIATGGAPLCLASRSAASLSGTGAAAQPRGTPNRPAFRSTSSYLLFAVKVCDAAVWASRYSSVEDNRNV